MSNVNQMGGGMVKKFMIHKNVCFLKYITTFFTLNLPIFNAPNENSRFTSTKY